MLRFSMLAAAALVVAGPASAAKVPATAPEAVKSLECAMWAAMVAGSIEDADTKRALEHSMMYWIGEYEGMTGLHFDSQATVQFLTSLEPRLGDLQTQCAPQMIDMGGRLQTWGQALQATASPAG